MHKTGSEAIYQLLNKRLPHPKGLRGNLCAEGVSSARHAAIQLLLGLAAGATVETHILALWLRYQALIFGVFIVWRMRTSVPAEGVSVGARKIWGQAFLNRGSR